MPNQTALPDLLAFYRNEHRLFARCPHCREPFRLSDTKITYGKEPPRDVLTTLKRERDRLSERIEDLEQEMNDQVDAHEDEIAALEDKHATETEMEVQERLGKVIKDARADAMARSRVTTLGRTIERIAPMLSGFGHHPGDVRPIFEPLDFVVFGGVYA